MELGGVIRGTGLGLGFLFVELICVFSFLFSLGVPRFASGYIDVFAILPPTHTDFVSRFFLLISSCCYSSGLI